MNPCSDNTNNKKAVVAGKERIWIIILLMLLLLTRASNLFLIKNLDGDEIAYDNIAVSVLQGKGFQESEGGYKGWRYPGYCYFLVASYYLGGYLSEPRQSAIRNEIKRYNRAIAQLDASDILPEDRGAKRWNIKVEHQSLLTEIRKPERQVAIFFQMVLTLLNAGMLYVLTRRSFGWITASVVVALFIFYPPFIRLPGRLYTENLSMPFFLMFWWMYLKLREKPHIKNIIFAGVIMGIGCLVREANLLLGTGLIFYEFIASLVQKEPKRAWALAGVVLFALMTISPWTIRNYRVFNTFVLLTTNPTANVYIGAQPGSDGFGIPAGRKPDEGPVRLIPPEEYFVGIDKNLEGEIKAGIAQTRASIEFITTHFTAWTALGFKRIFLLWTLPSVTYYNVHTRIEKLIEKAWDICYVVLLLLSVVGIIVGWKKIDVPAPIAVLLVIPTVQAFLTFVVSRFRFPKDMALMFFAAVALVFIYNKIMKKNNTTDTSPS